MSDRKPSLRKQLRLSMKLAKRGAKHFAFMEELAELPDLPTPEEEYKLAFAKLDEHEKECKGCSKARLVQIADDPKEVQRFRDDFKQRVSSK